MKDFSFLRCTTNCKINNSAKFLYEQQLNGIEGCDVKIDGVPSRAIVYNSINEYSDTEYRVLSVPFDTVIRRGSYVEYDDEFYLNTNAPDKHGTIYKSCKITRCNQIMKWADLPKEVENGFPVIMSNDSYGSKQSRSNDFLSEIDTKMKIQIQENEHTRRLRTDMRFIFNNSKYDIYRITDITTSTYKGMMVITAAKDVARIEDDFENNLAFNTVSNETPVAPIVSIEGDDSVKVGRTYTYTVQSNDPLTFSVDDVDIAEITNQADNSCEVEVKVKDEIFVLEAKNAAGEVVATKTVYTTR